MLYCFPIYKVIKAKLSNAHLFRYLACHVTTVRFSFLYTVGRLKSNAWKMQIGHTCIAPLERVPRTHARTVISTRRRATVHGARKTRLFVWPLRTRITGEIEECKRVRAGQWRGWGVGVLCRPVDASLRVDELRRRGRASGSNIRGCRRTGTIYHWDVDVLGELSLCARRRDYRENRCA